MVANIQQLHSNSDGTLCITPMQVQKLRQPPTANTTYTSSSCSQVSKITSFSNAQSKSYISGYHSPISGHQQHGHHHNHHTLPYPTSMSNLNASVFGGLGKSGGGGSGLTIAKQLKLNKAMLRNLNSDALVKSLEKQCIQNRDNFNQNNNNNNSIIANNNYNNNEITEERLVPKIESTEVDHSQAVIDQDGNIILRFGDGAPIKIECDSSDLRV